MATKEMALASYRLLSYVADECGFGTVEEMLASAITDCVCPGVCLRCKEIVEPLEPDGYCECPECGGSVRSVLLIAGMI